MAGAYQDNLRVDQQVCESDALPCRPPGGLMTETDDRDKPGPEPGIFRPSTAPAYYLGRPARLWITVMRPRRRRTTSDHPVQAVTGGGKQARHGTAAGRKIRSPLIPARFFPAPPRRGR